MAARPFGSTAQGQSVDAVEIAAGNLRAVVLTYGATLQDLRLAGTPWPLVLGGLDVAAYEGPLRFCGAIVGPVANRISGAAATLAGTDWHFDANEGGRTTLHGGSDGTSSRVWKIEEDDGASVGLSLALPHGAGGFPGNRRLKAEFRIEPPASLLISLSATTDAPTWINLANHSYWNLDGTADTAGHHLTVAADRYLPVDADLIPIGPARDVEGTEFDFRKGRQLDDVPRFDHALCLSDGPMDLREIARLEGQKGVSLTISSTEPSLQVYDGRGLSSTPFLGLTGEPYGPFAGVALEPQGWINAPNRPDFPSVELHAGKTYRQTLKLTLARGESG